MKIFLRNKKGFTLIELLVVVAIISLLSSIVFASVNTARAKTRNAKRKEDLVQVRTALELYANDHNGLYPNSVGNTWQGVGVYNGCPSCTYTGSSGYIPNLAPTYISVFPQDPLASSPFYIYNSNGVDYMFLSYVSVENCTNGVGTAGDPMTRPILSTECDYAVYSSGARNW